MEIGDVVFFYRSYQTAAGIKAQAARGCFVGPALVIGLQSNNVWVSYAGRCYLVAREHLRGFAPDEIFSERPLVKQGLAYLKAASRAKDFIDLSEQEVSAEDLAAAAGRPPAPEVAEPAEAEPEDPEERDEVAAPPTPLPATLGLAQAVELPVEEVEERVPVETVGPPLAQDQDMAEAPLPAVIPAESSSTRAQASGSWAPEGTDDNLRWKRRRKEARPKAGSRPEAQEYLGYLCMMQLSPVTASDNLRKRPSTGKFPTT